MGKRKNSVCGLISLIIITALNILWTLPLFGSMLKEQVEFGRGTQLEMGAIIIWIIEGICLIPYLITIVLSIISIIQKDHLPKIIINLIHIIIYLVAHVLANIWMFL